MTQKFIIAGSGGQGIMLLGKVLAEAAMYEGKHVTWLPSYGAEVRGGTAHCSVVISDKPIGSPRIPFADTVIMMNSPSLNKFSGRLSPKGIAIVNSSLADDNFKKAGMLKFPFTDIASKIGNMKVANMVALGCLIVNIRTVKKETIIKVFDDLAPSGRLDLIDITKRALDERMKLK